MSDLLLDTCAVLWLAKGTELKPEARAAIAGRNLHISPISAWEIANLARKSRIALTMPAAAWFRQAVGKMDAAVPALSIDILAGSCFLPGSPPSDPADRIIIATAREEGLAIVTRDDAILAYSQAGHVRTLAC
jgi:PIN domain nuclease of toxin-antitoxin system